MTTPSAGPLPLHASAWRALAWVAVLLIASTLAVACARGQWEMVLSGAIFLGASLGILLFARRLPALLRLMLVLVALVNGAGGTFDWFETHAWFDEAVHAWGGFAGLAAIGYLYAIDSRPKQERLVAWCAGMGLALGIGWEAVEEILGRLELLDTLSDIAIDTAGAALGGVFARRALRGGGNGAAQREDPAALPL